MLQTDSVSPSKLWPSWELRYRVRVSFPRLRSIQYIFLHLHDLLLRDLLSADLADRARAFDLSIMALPRYRVLQYCTSHYPSFWKLLEGPRCSVFYQSGTNAANTTNRPSSYTYVYVPPLAATSCTVPTNTRSSTHHSRRGYACIANPAPCFFFLFFFLSRKSMGMDDRGRHNPLQPAAGQ